MKKKRSTYHAAPQSTLVVVVAVLLLTVSVLAASLVWLYKPASRPNEELPFSTDPVDPPSTGDAVDDPIGDDIPDNPGPSTPAYVAREEVYNFLLIGHDRAASLADVIMLVNYDVNTGKITIMQLPRDTYYVGDTNKNQLNVQFSAYVNRAYYKGESKPIAVAANKFARILEQNLCIKIHYTAVVDLDGFVNIVNAVGGVDVYIPVDMDYDDPVQNLSIHLKKGPAHLNGEDAEGFVRFREGFVQADIGRVNAQKIFMTAFLDKVKTSISLTNLTVLNTLVNEVIKNLTTDIPATDFVYFGKNALSVDFANIRMLTVPGDYAGGSYVINRAATLQVINDFFNIYTEDITDSIFDKSRVFTNTESDAIHEAYMADKAAYLYEYTAEEIQNGSINIPTKPKKETPKAEPEVPAETDAETTDEE